MQWMEYLCIHICSNAIFVGLLCHVILKRFLVPSDNNLKQSSVWDTRLIAACSLSAVSGTWDTVKEHSLRKSRDNLLLVISISIVSSMAALTSSAVNWRRSNARVKDRLTTHVAMIIMRDVRCVCERISNACSDRSNKNDGLYRKMVV